MSSSSSSLAVQTCKFFSQFSAVVVFYAPYPTIQTIKRDGTVGPLPLLPYSSMILSAFLWMTYGHLVHEPAVTRTNMIGLFMGTYYFVTFVKYYNMNNKKNNNNNNNSTSSPSSSSLPGTVQLHINVILSIIAIAVIEIYFQPISTYVLTSTTTSSNSTTITDGPARVIGTMALGLCIGMFGSPLTVLKTVIKTRSGKSIPTPFTIATIINCTLWSIVGWYDMNDFNVYFPNLIGLFFGLIQLGLKMYYYYYNNNNYNNNGGVGWYQGYLKQRKNNHLDLVI